MSDVWECVLPDIGSLAMQRMLGRGMTINCCKVSCSGEGGGVVGWGLVGQRNKEQIFKFMILIITVQKR